MTSALRLLLLIITASLILASAALAQDAATAKPVTSLHFSNDPCGNPLLESQGWDSIEGKVLKVLDGRTVLLATPDAVNPVKVRIAGIALDAQKSISIKAREHLRQLLLNKNVEVLVNPEKWGDKHPRKIQGVVQLAEGEPSDAALDLLSEGLVRFTSPPSYTVSHHTICTYQRAESDARSKKIGLWQTL